MTSSKKAREAEAHLALTVIMPDFGRARPSEFRMRLENEMLTRRGRSGVRQTLAHLDKTLW
jgi:hypothetical protein